LRYLSEGKEKKRRVFGEEGAPLRRRGIRKLEGTSREERA
jgi:hypothetical protein